MKKSPKPQGMAKNAPNPKMAQKALTEKEAVKITRAAGKGNYGGKK